MNEKVDPKTIADTFSYNLAYMRTLLRTAGDKVQFYLRNRNLLGPCEQLLFLQARELDDLLALTERFLDRMDREMGTVSDLLYSIKEPPAV